MTAIPMHHARHQLTLGRCALGIVTLGVCVPYLVDLTVCIGSVFWAAIPAKHDLVGAQGYIDLFHANLWTKLDSKEVLKIAGDLGPQSLLCIAALAMLRGSRPMTLLVRRAMR